jgi:hypothetical protein
MLKARFKLAPSTLAIAACWSLLEQAHAVEIEPLGKALAAALGTTKVFSKKIDGNAVYYSKNAAGKADRYAMVEKNIYPPNCSHTWVVGLDSAGKVTQIRVNEMGCPHAFPAKQASFLDQYKGKGPADAGKIKGSVNTIAKATGTCDLASDAVEHSISVYTKSKGQL